MTRVQIVRTPRASRAVLLRVLGSLACLACVLAPAFAAQDDDTLQQFKKYFKQYKDSPTRVEAILTLQDLEQPAVIETVVPLLKDADAEVVRAAVRVLASLESQPCTDALLSVLKSERSEAVRVGLLRAVTDGKRAAAVPLVAPLLNEKSSWEVRRRAIQALSAIADASHAQAVDPLCVDPEPAVRCEAMEALTRWKSPLVVPHAIAALPDPVWQVRTSAIQALTKVRSKDSIGPLIERLSVEEGRLVPEIGEALAMLTGREFGASVEKWKEYWTANRESFVLPTDDAIAYLRGKKEARTGPARREYYKSGPTSFAGIDTPSRSIVFVIDVSGSMETTVVEKDRFADGKYPSYQRIDIVKTELARTVERLAPEVNFNIYTFATEVQPWKKRLVQANVLNKSAAKEWIARLRAIGGPSSGHLAQVGLVGASEVELGKTNCYDALMAALSVSNAPRTRDADYTTDVDTVFFFSDGEPTAGEYVEPDEILREVQAANELRKVVIHAIAIGEFLKDFPRKLAEQNGGVFVDLGK